jgi:hypothetical protein
MAKAQGPEFIKHQYCQIKHERYKDILPKMIYTRSEAWLKCRELTGM